MVKSFKNLDVIHMFEIFSLAHIKYKINFYRLLLYKTNIAQNFYFFDSYRHLIWEDCSARDGRQVTTIEVHRDRLEESWLGV